MVKKHRNADFWSRVGCDPYECDCYDRSKALEELPCGGCKTCKKRQDQWAIMDDVDDVVPLFARNVSCRRPQHSDDGKFSYIGIILILVSVLCGWCGAISGKAQNAVQVIGKSISCVTATLSRKVHRALTWPMRRLRLRTEDDSLGEAPLLSGANVEDISRENMTSGKSPLDDDLLRNGSSLNELKTSPLASYNPEQIREMQKSDPDIGILINWKLNSSERPCRDIVAGESPYVRHLWLLWDQLCLKDGILFKTWIAHKGTQSYLQLVSPSVLKKQVLESVHSAIPSGHLGVNKRAAKVQRTFYWYKWKNSVVELLQNCVTCGSRKRPGKTPKSPMTEYTVSFPMDRICTDILGPLPETNNGAKYVLCVQDSFTKYVECYAIPDQRSCTVADKLVFEFYSRYGCSLDLHSDRAANYQSELLREVCRLLEIKQTRTSGSRPMANGMIERFNSTLLNMISAYVDENQKDWDRYLPLLTMAFNSTVHASTGFTPYKLMFSRDCILPIQLQIGCLPSDPSCKTYNEYVLQLQEKQEQIVGLVRETLKHSVSVMKRNYDTRISQNTYNVDDLVYCLDQTKVKGRCKKIDPRIWKGPFVIGKKYSDLLFEVHGKPGSRSKLVHHDRLKPYRSESLPDWLTHKLDVAPNLPIQKKQVGKRKVKQGTKNPTPTSNKRQVKKSVHFQAVEKKKIASPVRPNKDSFPLRRGLRQRRPPTFFGL